MPWFKVDDSFSDHPKVKSIPRAERKGAVALWTLAGSYAARQLTEGFIFADDVEDLGGNKKDARALVTAGLWHEHGHECEDCPPVTTRQYLFHDWPKYQRPRAQVLAERAAAAERQRKAREAARSQRDSDRSNAVTQNEVTPLVTVPPTRPDPTVRTDELISGGQRLETLDPSDARCTAHQGVTDPGNCRGCMSARLAAEERSARAKLDAARARTNCRDCGGSGWIETDDGRPAGKCDHRHRRTG